MGWASGSELADEVWLLVRPHIKDKDQRTLVARQLIDAFENHDCDTMDECEQLCKDANRKTQWNGD